MTRADDQAVLQVLLDDRRLIRVKEGLYFHAEPLRDAETRVANFLRERKEITPQDMKDLLGISRKYAIPLLEYLDAQRLTVRVGDKRVLREAAR
jgi:selenocysteine-specific elongation factor